MEDCCTVSITSIELLTETFPGKNDPSATTVLPLTIPESLSLDPE